MDKVARNSMILKLHRLPIKQIAEQLRAAGMPAGLSAIRHILLDNGIKPAIDEAARRAKLREAWARNKEKRLADRLERPLPDEPADKGSQLVATLTPSQLEHARKILGSTNDINRAAAAVSMDPVRLRRHINNAR